MVLSTVLALLAAVGTYRLLDRPVPPEPTVTAENNISLTPDEPIDPDVATFTTFDDQTVSFASVYGAPTVVNFFASTCVPCITEMPIFEQVHKELGDSVTFLGLAVADRPEDAQELVTQTGVSYRTGQDRDGSVITALGGSFLPTTVLLDSDGTIVDVHTGELTAAELRALIADKLGVPG